MCGDHRSLWWQHITWRHIDPTDVAQDQGLDFIEVLEAFLTTVTANDRLQEQGSLIAHSELVIQEELRERSVENVLPEERVKSIGFFRLLVCFACGLGLSRLNHAQNAIESAKAVLPAARVKHLLKERDHYQGFVRVRCIPLFEYLCQLFQGFLSS